MRKIRFLLMLLLTVALVVVLNLRLKGKPAFGKLLNPTTGFWQNAETTPFYLPKHIAVEKLQQKTEVYFDERRIPHIFAENEHDLYFVQGYIVASLRLWQMEFQVLAAEGRIAETLGNEQKYIDFDKKQRRKGLAFGAKNKLKALEKDPLGLDLLNAYTEGVNAYIKNLKAKDLPIEYKLIGYKPEKWSNYKTMLVLMNMSDILADMGNDIENKNFIQKYGQALFQQIYGTEQAIEPVVPTPEKGWQAHLGLTNSTQKIDTNLVEPIIDSANKILSFVKETPEYHVGSNNWALAGEKTASGFPLLSSDPHLRFSLPSVWLEMHLVGPNSNAYGVCFPGAPAVIIGFNEYIGWGMTNSGRDVKDFYTIKYKDSTKELYQYNGKWERSEIKIEEIKVKGAKSVFDTVVYTHFGPVLHSNFKTQEGTTDIAVQWIAHKASQDYMLFYLLNRGKNFNDYLEATKYYECPAQNIVFACVDGDIALKNQGLFPIRENQDLLQAGNDAKKWDKFIPFQHNPMQYNPKRKFVASANQSSTDSTYPYSYVGWFEHYRNRVINKELSKAYKATIADMKALQQNNFNLKAAESLPLLLPYVNTSYQDFEAQAIHNALSNWDFYNHKTSKEAVYFEIFFNKYKELLWDEMTDGFIAPQDVQTIALLKDKVQHPLIDIVATKEKETTEDLINQAFVYTVSEVQKNKDQLWGEYNDVQFNHIAKIDAFSEKVIAGGGNSIVNATHNQWGPSWRMILDFADGKVKGVGVYPGGNSGNPGSRNYDDMLHEWGANQYHDLDNNKRKTYFEEKGYHKVAFLSK